MGCVCERKTRETETEKECSEMIVLLPAVQESGLKGKKHSILSENHVLIARIKFRKGMVDNLISGVYHRLLRSK